MKEQINLKITVYRERREAIFDSIRHSETLDSARVIYWAEQLQKIEVQLNELETLLIKNNHEQKTAISGKDI